MACTYGGNSMGAGQVGSTDSSALLGEYLSTITYILRNMKSNQLTPGECLPILEHLRQDLATTVNFLMDSLMESGLPSHDITRALAYLNKVDSVLQEMPTLLSILKKYPKGNKDLGVFIPTILGEFTRLAANFGAVMNKRNG